MYSKTASYISIYSWKCLLEKAPWAAMGSLLASVHFVSTPIFTSHSSIWRSERS